MHLIISSCLDGWKLFVSFGGYEKTFEKSKFGNTTMLSVRTVVIPKIIIHMYDLQNVTSLSVFNFKYSTMLYKTLKKIYLNYSKNFLTELRKV